MSQQGGLKGMLHRLTASEEQLESEELQRESERAGCKCADSVRRGELVTVAGRLRTVVYTPRTNLPTLEADLYDGTDVITLVFLGRRQIAGVEPGRAVLAKGRVADRDGRKVIYNPHYELEAAT
jgi:RecJ-like exonuclease